LSHKIYNQTGQKCAFQHGKLKTLKQMIFVKWIFCMVLILNDSVTLQDFSSMGREACTTVRAG